MKQPSHFQGFLKLTKSCSHFPKISLTNADLKSGCKVNKGKNWLLNPGTSSQSEGYSSYSKWLIWLVCREPLTCSHSPYPTNQPSTLLYSFLLMWLVVTGIQTTIWLRLLTHGTSIKAEEIFLMRLKMFSALQAILPMAGYLARKYI